MNRRAFLFSALSAASMLTGFRTTLWPERKQFVHRTQFLMGTLVEIKAYHASEKKLNAAITEAFDSIRTCEDLMSVYQPTSDVSRINAAAGREAVQVSQDVIDIIEYSLHVARLTGGAFNITVVPLMTAWGFRDFEKKVSAKPSKNELLQTVHLLNAEKVLLDKSASTVKLSDAGMALDLGGVAVGYSVDKAASALRRAGIDDFLINHSGDLIAFGQDALSGVEGWRVEIRNPNNDTKPIQTVVLKNEAVSTSGNYENVRVYNGEAFGHIMNPHTGYPAETLVSASAIAKSSLVADAYSTAIFAMPATERQSFMNRVLHEAEFVLM
jgi:thiamine biosynthesis lipoprotein